jgi:uncharacterized protein YxjI
MKNIFSTNKRQKTTLYEKNLKIHGNLWKFYGLSLFIGILIVLLKGLN